MNIRDARAAERAALEKKLRSTTSPWDRLPLLLELTREPTRNDPHYSYQCAQEALSLAKELKDPFWTACSMRSIGIYLLRTSRYSDVLYYLNEAAQIFGQLNDLPMKMQTDLPIANTYLYLGKWEEALKLLVPCKQFFEEMGPPHWHATALRSLGSFYQGIGNHSKAIEYHRQSIAIAVEAEMTTELGSYYANLAMVYGNIEDHKSMEKYLRKSLTLFRRADWKVGVSGALANLALLYLDQQEYDRAEKYIRASGKLCQEIGHTLYEAMAWGQLGTVYMNRGNYSRALGFFGKAISMMRNSEHAASRGALYHNLGNLYILTGDHRRGISCLKKALSLMNKSGQSRHQYRLHERLAEVYEMTGNSSRALKHYKRHVRIRDEYINVEKSLEVGRMEMQTRIKGLAEKLHREHIKSEELRKEIEMKERALVVLTLNLIRNTEEERKKGRSINCSAELPSENWETFSRQFYKVHHNFYSNLVRRFPSLTPTEIKVCSLIRIGLSSKDIAGILCISKRTVDNHRAHAHKKMNLPQGASLSGFILRIGVDSR